MSVYFVYRSHYAGPAGRHVRILPGETVLEWFQSVWAEAKNAPDPAEWAKTTLGCDVYGFSSLFEAAADEELKPPKTDRTLSRYLDEHLYVEGEILYKPHALQVLTDDDEIELAYYVFDDQYVREHPERTAYLLHDDWRLPTGAGAAPFEPAVSTKPIGPGRAGAGATYLAFLAFYDSGGLTDLDTEGPRRVAGVRIPDLGRYLREVQPDDHWPHELQAIRTKLVDGAHDDLGQAFQRVSEAPQSMFSFDCKGFDPARSLVSTSEHLAQVSLHVGEWFGKDVYHQWIFFDNCWAGVNRELADGILRYATRWDVLSEK